MAQAGTLIGASLLAVGLVGAGIATRPAPAQDPAAIAAALAPAERRIAALEAAVQRAAREKAAADAATAEAMSVALDAKRELDQVNGRIDDVLASLGAPAGASGQARTAGARPSAPAHAGLASPAPAAEIVARATTDDGSLGASAFAAAAEPAPREIAAARKALEQIRKEEAEQEQKQRDERRAQMLQRRLADLTQKLALNPQQAEKLGAIWTASDAKRREVFDAAMQSGADRGQVREQMQALRTDEQKQVQETLTAQQYTDLQKIEEEQGPGPGGPPGWGPPPPGGGARRGGGGGGG